ncbi:hypothetical protein BU23DRAFT_557189, partial [Bimuria novae-zelandiae CBS 107.79]
MTTDLKSKLAEKEKEISALKEALEKTQDSFNSETELSQQTIAEQVSELHDL